MKRAILSIITAGIWITVSEFIRNQFLFKNYWVEHFGSLGLKFETLPINGILWIIWSFIFAYVIFLLLKKFSFFKTMLIAWLSAFVMMWITLYNLLVLPLKLLIFAVPLSLIETAIAVFIIKKVSNLKSV